MKYSKQREIILKTLIENKIHPSAEKLYTLLLDKGKRISIATVYRNLNALADAGIIKKFKTAEKKERFDSTTEQHYHFLCTKCGKVYDLPVEIASDITKKIQEYGFTVTEYDMILEGRCPECQ